MLSVADSVERRAKGKRQSHSAPSEATHQRAIARTLIVPVSSDEMERAAVDTGGSAGNREWRGDGAAVTIELAGWGLGVEVPPTYRWVADRFVVPDGWAGCRVDVVAIGPAVAAARLKARDRNRPEHHRQPRCRSHADTCRSTLWFGVDVRCCRRRARARGPAALSRRRRRDRAGSTADGRAIGQAFRSRRVGCRRSAPRGGRRRPRRRIGTVSKCVATARRDQR